MDLKNLPGIAGRGMLKLAVIAVVIVGSAIGYFHFKPGISYSQHVASNRAALQAVLADLQPTEEAVAQCINTARQRTPAGTPADVWTSVCNDRTNAASQSHLPGLAPLPVPANTQHMQGVSIAGGSIVITSIPALQHRGAVLHPAVDRAGGVTWQLFGGICGSSRDPAEQMLPGLERACTHIETQQDRTRAAVLKEMEERGRQYRGFATY